MKLSLPGKEEIFTSLNLFFDLFLDYRPSRRTREKFLQITGYPDGPDEICRVIAELRAVYAEALRITEAETVRSGFREELLSLQKNLYRELEYILSLDDKDPRRHFLIVIPVADRPLMLKNCLASLVEQCRLFRYGGILTDSNGLPRYKKISVFIIDDSRDESNRRITRELTSETLGSGIPAYYIGLEEQTDFLNRLPAEHRNKLGNLIGASRNFPSPHKGASVTRNIACLYIHSILGELNDRALIFFMDSDEEFKLKVNIGDSTKEVHFINYFHLLDRIFESSGIEALTGKVVGDPPVSPAVMINTFLDDILSFLESMAGRGASDECGFHQKIDNSAFSAEYHDMVKLFGYDAAKSPRRYNCLLSGAHTIKDCFEDFSYNAMDFFYGFHPTRPQIYRHAGDMEKTESARTVYTGNYVCTSVGLRHFIPFAGLNLRMAGPTLGRILRTRIREGFVSANLPLLHRRTIAEKNIHEFRRGLKHEDDTLDLSEEFHRQFWGDIMLFSIDALAESGYPDQETGRRRITDTVKSTLDNLWDIYRQQQADSVEKLRRIRHCMSGPLHWWNNHAPAEDSVKRLQLFCSFVEHNFGPNSGSMKKLAEEISRGDRTRMIIDAICSFPEDDRAWNNVLKMVSAIPSVAG